MRTPTMPQTTVSQIGMLSRSPGATNLPSSPMMMPITMTKTQPMRNLPLGTHRVGGTCSLRSLRGETHTSHRKESALRGGSSAAEADLSGCSGADLDVGDVAGRDQYQAPAEVGEGERAVVPQGLVQGRLDVVRRVGGVDGQLARRVLHSDLDFHRSPSSGLRAEARGTVARQWSSVSG